MLKEFSIFLFVKGSFVINSLIITKFCASVLLVAFVDDLTSFAIRRHKRELETFFRLQLDISC